jgi:hypothetical protein
MLDGTYHQITTTAVPVASRPGQPLRQRQPRRSHTHTSRWRATWPFTLGRDLLNGNPNAFLRGQVDDIAVYDYPMTAAEVTALYTTQSARRPQRPVSHRHGRAVGVRGRRSG